MPEDPEMYWDNSEYDDEPSEFDDDYSYDDDPAMDDADDFFELRTFDTGLFDDDPPEEREEEPVARRHAPPAPRPAPERIVRSPAPAAAISLQRTPAYSPPMPRRRAPSQPRSAWVTLRTILIVVMAAALVSTLFSLWTRPDFFSDEFSAGLNQVQATQRVINIQPSPLPTESRTVKIGVIAGHSGRPQDESFESDPGAVCPDGLTELSINQAVAREVVAGLRRLEYEVDLLDEFDDQLAGYQADVLISLHTNDCQDYGAAGTGFGAASASARQTTRGEDEFLLECLISEYQRTTGLPQHFGLTYDMTEYHTFSEVSIDTPTAIIELGFMNKDRLMLTTQQSLLAQGVVNGILCFLQPDDFTGG